MQAKSERGKRVEIRLEDRLNVKDVTESTEGEQEVMGMGAGKGASSLWAALEIMFLPRNKFKET